MKSTEHPFSWNAIFRLVLTGVTIYVFFVLQSTILLIFVSGMLAAALYPFVKFLHKRMVPLSLSAVLVMLLILMPLVLIFVLVLPPLYRQYPSIVDSLSNVINHSDKLPVSLRDIDFDQYTKNAWRYLLSSTSVLTNAIFNFLTVVFLTLYFLIDAARLKRLFLLAVPHEEEEKIEVLIDDLTKINGQYIRGNLLISFICFVCTYICLLVLGVPYAAPLALFAAVFDLLPLIGAFIGAAPAMLLAFSISPTIGILVVIFNLVYQQVENNIIGPEVYDKALDISPALSFIAFILGTSLLGITGAFISLPIAASIPTIVKYARSYRQKSSKTLKVNS
jgi:predicted PurR-regulated permease PerM